MFNKPFKVKSNTQLKGSERKKLRQEILKSFPELREEDVLSIIPNKEAVSAIKIFTHAKDLIMVYFATGVPLVFEYENVLYPTVYLLWRYPDLLYCFTTWPQVFPKLASGADLMVPGVVFQGEFNVHSYGSLKKGDKVGINITTNRAPIAVGVTYHSSLDMYLTVKKGKAVRILHFLGDELWALGNKVSVPNLGPPGDAGHEASGFDEEKVNELSSQVEDTHLEEPESETASSTPQKGEEAASVSVEEVVSDETSEKENEERDMMDDLLMYCFLKALRTTAKKSEYPMLVSTFCKQHLLPACPHGRSLDIKKTSFKKSSKFLGEMDNLGIIKLKEITKGVQKIMSIDLSHPKLREFMYSDEDSGKSQSAAAAAAAAAAIEHGNKGKPEIKEMYVVTASVLPLFKHFGHGKGTSLPLNMVRKHVTDYVKEANLQNTSDKRLVNLDATLKKVTNVSDETQNLPWEDLITKVIGRMTHSYQCAVSGKTPVVSKGKLQPVTIHVAKRTGNKKVTLIDNLELFGVAIHEFARQCQHGVAASTSISHVPGKKSQQLMVQGDQTVFVEKLLRTKYELPKRYILICT